MKVSYIRKKNLFAYYEITRRVKILIYFSQIICVILLAHEISCVICRGQENYLSLHFTL